MLKARFDACGAALGGMIVSAALLPGNTRNAVRTVVTLASERSPVVRMKVAVKFALPLAECVVRCGGRVGMRLLLQTTSIGLENIGSDTNDSLVRVW